MPSYLGEYENCASNRDYKFIRSVNSFLSQTYNNAELIIISDGCIKTIELVNEYFKNELKYGNIKLKSIQKQHKFAGTVRQYGIDIAKGDLICYLDTDDVLGPLHLKILKDNYIHTCEWCYYDDYVFNGVDHNIRNVTTIIDRIGTSNLVHKNNKLISWKKMNGYGHDWKLINNIMNLKHNKIKTPQYYVYHIPQLIDF
jgi:glycosyltransferase involved in cell wall biosynthesis